MAYAGPKFGSGVLGRQFRGRQKLRGLGQGPNPSPQAYAHANSNAAFNRPAMLRSVIRRHFDNSSTLTPRPTPRPESFPRPPRDDPNDNISRILPSSIVQQRRKLRMKQGFDGGFKGKYPGPDRLKGAPMPDWMKARRLKRAAKSGGLGGF